MGSWWQFVICRRVASCISMNRTVHRRVANMVAAVLFFLWGSVKFSRYLVLRIVSNYLSRCFNVIVRRHLFLLMTQISTD